MAQSAELTPKLGPSQNGTEQNGIPNLPKKKPHLLGMISRANIFLWRGKVWNFILFRSTDSCGLKVWSCRTNWARPNWEFEWNGAPFRSTLGGPVAQSVELSPTFEWDRMEFQNFPRQGKGLPRQWSHHLGIISGHLCSGGGRFGAPLCFISLWEGPPVA